MDELYAKAQANTAAQEAARQPTVTTTNDKGQKVTLSQDDYNAQARARNAANYAGTPRPDYHLVTPTPAENVSPQRQVQASTIVGQQVQNQNAQVQAQR